MFCVFISALSEFDRRLSATAEAKRRELNGEWVEDSETDAAEAMARKDLMNLAFDSERTINSIHHTYRQLIRQMLVHLRDATSSATHLRQLHFLLDFNSYYHELLNINIES